MNREEARLQARMVIEFSQERPHDKGRLIGYFAETENKIEGATKLSLGLVKGCSDLLYIPEDNQKVVGIEVKAPGSRHKVLHLKEQCHWLLKVPYKGYFCDTIEMFWDIIEGGRGIDPDKVFDYLLTVKTESVAWNDIKKKCYNDDSKG